MPDNILISILAKQKESLDSAVFNSLSFVLCDFKTPQYCPQVLRSFFRKFAFFYVYEGKRRKKLTIIQWRNSYYRTFQGPILHLLVTFYFIYTMKCDQKVEYGTTKSSIVRISPMYKEKQYKSG